MRAIRIKERIEDVLKHLPVFDFTTYAYVGVIVPWENPDIAGYLT